MSEGKSIYITDSGSGILGGISYIYNEPNETTKVNGTKLTRFIEYSAYEQSQSRIAELEAENERLKSILGEFNMDALSKREDREKKLQSANRILRDGLDRVELKTHLTPFFVIKRIAQKAIAEADMVMEGE